MNSALQAPALLTAAGLIAVNRALLATGARRRIDGWRRATGLMLRTDASTFVLSAFGLDAWSDAPGTRPANLAQTHDHVAERLAKFLRTETGTHIAVLRGAHEDAATTHAGPTYTLAFEPMPGGPSRFVPPAAWDQPSTHPGAPPTHPSALPLMNIVCRVSDAGRVDLWARVNHVGADGVPVQETLTRLEAAWGGSGDVQYPSTAAFAPHTAARPIPGRPDLAEVQMFIDFAPLLDWRKRANAKLPTPMTLSAAVLWSLARHEAFADAHIGTTVEVAPTGGLNRGVGVVVIRPADFSRRIDGLSRYVTAFNTQLELTRRRASASCKTLDAAAHLPPTLATTVLRHALENDPRAFGTMAVTMLKDARVFGAPIAQHGHAQGFIAIGSVALPTPDGSRVGCVTVKGPRSTVADYPRILPELFARCGISDPS